MSSPLLQAILLTELRGKEQQIYSLDHRDELTLQQSASSSEQGENDFLTGLKGTHLVPTSK